MLIATSAARIESSIAHHMRKQSSPLLLPVALHFGVPIR